MSIKISVSNMFVFVDLSNFKMSEIVFDLSLGLTDLFATLVLEIQKYILTIFSSSIDCLES